MVKKTSANRPISGLDARQGPVRVLIVEHDTPVREGLARALSVEQYEVATAATGREAIQHQGHSGKVDALVLDLDMPDRDRWYAVRQLIAANPLLSVIGMTGRAMHQSLAEVAELQAVVLKPFSVEMLVQCLEAVPVAGLRN